MEDKAKTGRGQKAVKNVGKTTLEHIEGLKVVFCAKQFYALFGTERCMHVYYLSSKKAR
jgi:hypothetical protein